MVGGEPDLVLLRSGRSIQLDRADRLVAAGIPVINDPVAHRAAGDKLHQARVFAARRIAHPATAGVDREVAERGGPVVVKPRWGSSGVGVRLVDPADLPGERGSDVVVQEWIEGATEYRVLVVDGLDVDWAEKELAPGEFRANLARGATMRPASAPDGESARAARGAVEALGLDIGGVDLMVGPSGPVVLEVNAATTLHGSSDAGTEVILRAVLGLCAARAAGGARR